MPLKVSVHFTGLCAFVPAKPIDQLNNEATIVLVNAMAMQSSHVPHYALCFADKNNVYKNVAGNRHVDLSFTYNIDGVNAVDVNGCRFNMEELTIVGRTAAGLEVPLASAGLTFDSTAIGQCQDSAPQSFRWVANMATLNAGKASQNALTTLGGLVVMRTKLTQGSLKTHSFRVISSPKAGTVRWSFNGGVTSAPLAEEVRWDYEFQDPNVVEVVIKSSAGSLVLQPNVNLVEAWIVNMPLGQILGFDPAMPMDPDDHFAEFFRLADGSPTPVIPVPFDNSCPPPISPSNPKCPPAQFAPLSP